MVALAKQPRSSIDGTRRLFGQPNLGTGSLNVLIARRIELDVVTLKRCSGMSEEQARREAVGRIEREMAGELRREPEVVLDPPIAPPYEVIVWKVHRFAKASYVVANATGEAATDPTRSQDEAEKWAGWLEAAYRSGFERGRAVAS